LFSGSTKVLSHYREYINETILLSMLK